MAYLKKFWYGRIRTWNGYQMIGLLIYLFLCYFPLVNLLLTAFSQSDRVLPTLFNARQWNLFGHSLLFSLVVAFLGTVLGFLTAVKLFYWRSNLRWLPLVFLALPAYIHALTWMGVFQQINRWLVGIGFTSLQLNGWGLAGFVQILYLFPLAYALVLVGLASIDPAIVASGQMDFPGIQVLIRILLPLLKPFLIASAALLFLLSLLDYSIPYLFAVNVYALEIFAGFSANADLAHALWIATPLVIVSICLLVLVLFQFNHISVKPNLQQEACGMGLRFPGWLRLLINLAVMVLVFQMAAPLLVTIGLTGSWQSFLSSTRDGLGEAGYSLRTAFFTALLSIPLSYAVAQRVKGVAIWLVVLLPFAIPPSLIGIAMISAWNQSGFHFLYNTDWMPVLTHLVRFLPLAVLIFSASLNRRDQRLVEAGQVFQTNRFLRWLQIDLPLLAPGLISAMCLVFVFSLGELPATLLVLPPGRSTLTLRIFNFLHYGSAESVAGLSLFLILIALFGGALVLIAQLLWQRLSLR